MHCAVTASIQYSTRQTSWFIQSLYNSLNRTSQLKLVVQGKADMRTNEDLLSGLKTSAQRQKGERYRLVSNYLYFLSLVFFLKQQYNLP